jgi:hypothetical protein
MLELTTCGAIAPYNALLGGKLTALLMLSPEVSDDYRRRYGVIFLRKRGEGFELVC